MFKNADSFEICNVIMICKAAEIILTLSATFKASADQQSVDVKTDFTFLGHDDLFSQIYMTPPEGQTQVIARAQSISLIHCLFRLVKCKFTEPHYKSAWYTLLSLLIFSTYALSIKREGRNLTKKKKRKYRGCCGCCIPLRLCSQKRGIAILRLPRQPYMYGPLSSRHVVLFAAFKSIVREVTQDCLIWIDTQGCGVSLLFEV